MDLAGLISSFGGNLGLFAGMSLITIVQFFAHIFYACVGVMNEKPKRQRISGVPVTSSHDSNPNFTGSEKFEIEDYKEAVTPQHIPRPIHL